MRIEKTLLTLVLLALLPVAVCPGSSSLIIRSVYAFNGQHLAIIASATPTAGKAPLNVTFTGTVSGGSPPYAMFWDFDDGSTASSSIATHLYRFPGNFTAEFWVQDSAVPPAKLSQSITITVHGVGTLSVRVVDQSGNPLTLATVQMLTGPDGQELLAHGTAIDGSVDFGSVAEGVYTLETVAAGFKNSVDTVTVFSGNPAFKEVVLVPEDRPSWPLLASLVAYLSIGATGAAILAFLARRHRKRTPRQSVPATEKSRTPKGTSPPKRPRSTRLLESP